MPSPRTARGRLWRAPRCSPSTPSSPWERSSCPDRLVGYRRDGNAADGEAYKVVAVAEGATGDARDAGLVEKREDVFARRKLAPVVDRAAVVEVDGGEEVMFLVERVELASEPLAPQPVQRANLVFDLG